MRAEYTTDIALLGRQIDEGRTEAARRETRLIQATSVMLVLAAACCLHTERHR